MIACKIAEAAGALSVTVVEPHPRKRELAFSYGAQLVFDPREDGWKQKLLGSTPDHVGLDVVLEMSGSVTGIHDAFDLVRPGGDVALLGIPSREVQLDLSGAIIFKGVTVRGINGRLMFQTWYQCERFLMDHKLDLRPVITHRFPYRDYEQAFAVLEQGEGIKVLLDWEED